jgi:hypothetical protein
MEERSSRRRARIRETESPDPSALEANVLFVSPNAGSVPIISIGVVAGCLQRFLSRQ